MGPQSATLRAAVDNPPRRLYAFCMRRVLVPLALTLLGCPHSPPPATPLSGTEKAEAARLLAVAEVAPSQLEADEGRRRLVRLASGQKCPCPDTRGTLAECAERKSGGCIRAAFAVRAIVRAVVRGETEEAISARLVERFGPREPERIDISGAPCRGSASAPVTMVVFSDFQCPFCGLGAKLTEAVEHEAGDRLRVCFKHWPLTRIHPRAQLAAQAAVAAQLQGKFWQMHDRLYGNQKDLDRGDFADHARELGLDVERFKRDLDSEAVRGRVAADVAEADRLQLDGTPTFLINGRRMTDPKSVPDFLDWIAEAIALSRAVNTPASRAGPASRPAGD